MKSVDVRDNCELVLDIDRFRTQLRQLLLNPEQLALGTLRRRETIAGDEWIIERWQSTSTVIDPSQLPFFHRFAVMSVSNNDLARSEQLISSMKLRSGQTLVAILVHPHRVNQLDISIYTGGCVEQPIRLHFVGSRMESLANSTAVGYMEEAKPNTEDGLLRASRTDGALGKEVAAKCRRLRMLVVGAGSGGSEVVRQFASLTPEHITVVDGDLVGTENLNALPYASLQDVEFRRPKVHSLLRSILRNQPDL